MGSPATEKGRYTNEGPQHSVTIAKPFAVSKFDVTFADWDACVLVGGCPKVSDSGFGRGTRPVINVSWDDAQQYVAWLSEMTGKPYRLLSEAEWEYAARAGTTTAYFWGDEIGKGTPIAMGAAANGIPANLTSRIVRAQCVRPLRHGRQCVAMGAGLLSRQLQWSTRRWFGVDSGDCSRRAARGGSWNDDPLFVRSAVRDGAATADRDYHGGFRLGRTLTP